MDYAIALGSNLGDRLGNFERAIKLIEERCGTVVLRSQILETLPVNHPSTPELRQPMYLNGVIVLRSLLLPEPLLDRLLEIERELGRDRERSQRWGPREIDLDIVAAENLMFFSPRLTVPHPEMHRRAFVLKPLAQVLPEWRHPVLAKTAAELAAQVAA